MPTTFLNKSPFSMGRSFHTGKTRRPLLVPPFWFSDSSRDGAGCKPGGEFCPDPSLPVPKSWVTACQACWTDYMWTHVRLEAERPRITWCGCWRTGSPRAARCSRPRRMLPHNCRPASWAGPWQRSQLSSGSRELAWASEWCFHLLTGLLYCREANGLVNTDLSTISPGVSLDNQFSVLRAEEACWREISSGWLCSGTGSVA